MSESERIIKITVRIEVPVIFPLPADADERGVTWDDLNEAALDRVNGLIPGDLARAMEEIVAMRGPGSGGTYTHGIPEILAAPHLSADFPASKCTSDDPTNHQGKTCPVHEA